MNFGDLGSSSSSSSSSTNTGSATSLCAAGPYLLYAALLHQSSQNSRQILLPPHSAMFLHADLNTIRCLTPAACVRVMTVEMFVCGM
jgi:hypothetical protein